MTFLSNKKRLDSLEVSLSPEEWAIRLADQMRSHPSELDFLQIIAKGTFEGSPIIHPFRALREQAEEQHPGENPGDIRNRIQLERALRTEYHALKTLIGTANDAVRTMAEIASIKAALKLTRLEMIVLRDAFARTAKNSVELIQQYKPTGADEEKLRQGVMEEFTAYSNLYFNQHSSILGDWIDEVVALGAGVWAQRAAIQTVQDQYFDGHPILFLDVEEGLSQTIATLEVGIATFNAYLKTRAELLKGYLEDRLAVDIDAVRIAAVRLQTKPIAAEWIKNAKEIAKADMLEETNEHGGFLWDRLRNEFGVNP